ncbi:hypothetical protein HanPI659440_Chr06g0245701 [Helianthus annuus]|nr:hypothetical protein HanPI659440_Chr06g0245701 [Helianthus annuus]
MGTRRFDISSFGFACFYLLHGVLCFAHKVVRYFGLGNLLSGVAGVVMGRLERFL